MVASDDVWGWDRYLNMPQISESLSTWGWDRYLNMPQISDNLRRFVMSSSENANPKSSVGLAAVVSIL
jgi:hypothetical protein